MISFYLLEATISILISSCKLSSLSANPLKCKIYFGNVDEKTKEEIYRITTFKDWSLPVRYLGIPLTSKKKKLLLIALLLKKWLLELDTGMLVSLDLLVECNLWKVCYSISNLWMQNILRSKKVIKAAEAVCRSFLWSGGDKIMRKSPVA